MRIEQQDPYWNAGATDIQQLNPNGPDQRTEHRAPSICIEYV